MFRIWYSLKSGNAVSAMLTTESKRGSKANRKIAKSLEVHLNANSAYVNLPRSKGTLKGFAAMLKRAAAADDADSVSIVKPFNRAISEIAGLLANFESIEEGLTQGAAVRSLVESN